MSELDQHKEPAESGAERTHGFLPLADFAPGAVIELGYAVQQRDGGWLAYGTGRIVAVTPHTGDKVVLLNHHEKPGVQNNPYITLPLDAHQTTEGWTVYLGCPAKTPPSQQPKEGEWRRRPTARFKWV